MRILNLISVYLLPTFKPSFLFLLLVVCGQAVAFGQATDSTSAIEQKLVELALQSPEVKNTIHQTKIDGYTLKAAQNQWTNLLSLSINYNEQTIKATPTPANVVFPRYFFGVNIPLGTLLSRTAVKSARENVEIGKNNVELIKREIRQQVLTLYREYLAFGQLIANQNELVNDFKAQLSQSEEKFRNATITLDAYNLAQKSYNNEMANLINLRLQQDLKKLELEGLINTKLENVLK